MEESINIVEKAAQSGVKTIVLTPHFTENGVDDLPTKILKTAKKFMKEVSARKIDIHIVLGAEFYIFCDLPTFVIENKEFIIKLNNNYVLMELPLYYVPDYVDDVIYELLVNQIIPIIAHPERNFEIQEHPDKLEKLIRKGALAQLNAGSLYGVYGKRVKKTARNILKKKLVHMMGSDIHSFSKGTYPLSKGLSIAKKITGRMRADALVHAYPVNAQSIFAKAP